MNFPSSLIDENSPENWFCCLLYILKIFNENVIEISFKIIIKFWFEDLC
jgi:hypothetical protein